MSQPRVLTRPSSLRQPTSTGYTWPLPVRSDVGYDTGYVGAIPPRRRLQPQQTPEVDRILERRLLNDSGNNRRPPKRHLENRFGGQSLGARRQVQGKQERRLQSFPESANSIPLQKRRFPAEKPFVNHGLAEAGQVSILQFRLCLSGPEADLGKDNEHCKRG